MEKSILQKSGKGLEENQPYLIYRKAKNKLQLTAISGTSFLDSKILKYFFTYTFKQKQDSSYAKQVSQNTCPHN